MITRGLAACGYAPHRTYYYYHVFVPGRALDRSTRTAGLATSTLREDPDSIPRSCSSNPHGCAVIVPDRYRSRSGEPFGDSTAGAVEARGGVDPDA